MIFPGRVGILRDPHQTYSNLYNLNLTAQPTGLGPPPPNGWQVSGWNPTYMLSYCCYRLEFLNGL